MTDLKDLIRSRGTYKARLTQFINFIDSLKVSTVEQKAELQIRLSKLESLYDGYDNIQSQLESSCDNPQEQYEARNEFEGLYYSTLARGQTLLAAAQSNADTSSTSHKVNVKLPEISLGSFDGTYSQWMEFRDMFTSLIHNNENISPTDKFHYLRSALLGSASLVIKSIETTADNYSVAWNLLCERYNNKRLLISNHVKSLFNIFPIQKENAFNLRRLADSFVKNIKSLEMLGEPVQQWNTLLIYIASSKLDSHTLFEWEKYKTHHDCITFEDMMKFIRNKADLVETVEQRTANTRQVKSLVTSQLTQQLARIPVSKIKYSCPICQKSHSIYYCKTFQDLSLKERVNKAKQTKLCLNCLKTGHATDNCYSGSCKRCGEKHNTLLHFDTPSSSGNEVTLSCSSSEQGLLSTAIIDVNKFHPARAILDSGSTSNFITEKLFLQLNVPTYDIATSISGFNNNISQANKACIIKISSKNSNFSFDTSCIIIKNITNPWPNELLNMDTTNMPNGVRLADPNFNVPAPIDILLGNGIFWDLLGTRHINLKNSNVTLHETKLGWIVSGSVNSLSSHTFISSNKSNINMNTQDINDQLARFWELDQVDNVTPLSKEDNICELNFTQNTQRLTNGRFQVTIPLSRAPDTLGDSYILARQRFLSLERKLQRDAELKAKYKQFLQEYIQLGHMTESNYRAMDDNSRPTCYYAPHHGVIKETSSTTKLRVVFDCSAKTTTGLSFNNIQHVGPTIQDTLFSILLRFRQHNIALVADIEKMYRQVEVHPKQRCLQQILWRDSPEQPIKTFELNTVTYGTASAAFLSIRCLKQLSYECKDPIISEIIAKDFLVDDLITGADSHDQIAHIYKGVTNTLQSGCFPIRKWRSNDMGALKSIAENCVQNTADNFYLCSDYFSKILGINWDSQKDYLCFTINIDFQGSVTKRKILSIISQIFDPLGFLSPIIYKAKIMLQQLWLRKLEWDEPVPEDIRISWLAFINSLPTLNCLRISRHVLCPKPNEIQLHTFVDASEHSYGACVYIRSIDNSGQVFINLLCSKGRVAPIKPLTTPRLELCGALLGSELAKSVQESMRLKFDKCFFWTDSSTVLGWLKKDPYKLHTFVRSRITSIQSTTHEATWKHVPTADNPADSITRGLTTENILNNHLWWNGPNFLQNSEESWPNILIPILHLPEVKQNDTSLMTTHKYVNFPFPKFSSFTKMLRIGALLLRYMHNLQNKTNKLSGTLSPAELLNSKQYLASLSQRESFPNELKILKGNKQLKKESRILKLNPFIDSSNNYHDLMRVGGRISNADYEYDKIHPILLHKDHHFTKLLFEYEHKRLLHAGPQHLLYSIRETFWSLGGRDLARLVVHRCIRCTRLRGDTVTPIMGNLPQQRLKPNFPFQVTSVDYAGPILMADRSGRGCKLIKAYICIFVCFVTKAIHIELVSDMSTPNYIAALNRFISRRGKPSDIYSDNGSNFVGACNEMKRVLSNSSKSITESLSLQGINFHFLPPQAPHFGGLHEAGVKSVKHHLKRVLSLAHLTYEQLYTTLTQIEAILNSRPLTPLSSDPDDMLPLTPSHFLIGRPANSIPEADLTSHNMLRLDKYQRIQKLRQHFWTRWQLEYIGELQSRCKWKQSKDELKIGTLVVVKDKQLPPLKWLLGRIIKTYPGRDNINRVADIKTITGVIKRDFSKICPLPVETST